MSPYRTLTLASLLIPTALVAQQPVVPFGQALRAAIGDVQQFLKDFKSREALARIEGILPAEVPAWADKTKSFVKDGTIAHIGNHRHKMNGRNDAYTFTYLYRLGFDIAPGAGKLTLPEDADINIFAITVSGNRIDGTRWACEPRALPVIE